MEINVKITQTSCVAADVDVLAVRNKIYMHK